MAEVNLSDISSNSNASRKTEESKQLPVENELIEYKPVKKPHIVGDALSKIGVNTNMGDVAGSVWDDVIVPAFLDVCRDAMYTAADYIFGGGVTRASQKKKSGGGYTSYGNTSAKNARKVRKPPAKASYELTWDTRDEAIEIYNQMIDVVDRMQSISIQEMLTLDHKSTDNYMLGYWGWKDVNNVKTRRDPGTGKFYLDLPKPEWIGDDQ
jgi:hypothetical protein